MVCQLFGKIIRKKIFFLYFFGIIRQTIDKNGGRCYNQLVAYNIIVYMNVTKK